MKRGAKVAISLPDELLQAIDQVRRATGASRSQYFREAAAARLQVAEQTDLERYIKGYMAQPETGEEVAAAEASALDVFSAHPFE